MNIVTALKHAWLHLGLQELQGGGSKLYIHNRKRSRCQWPLALCGYQSPLVLVQQKTNPKELLVLGDSSS